ncbi:hypothetical protein TcasGA2_TC013299 [Tribolium castaneum]|uniref:Uncharacterized protein n=1 Tax=Tribolium castaneum TaxID=7070 RepID=D6WP67_TRICA|nr:hypothetical protein TcasGA2_TC013299 [Tribolium castaneum]
MSPFFGKKRGFHADPLTRTAKARCNFQAASCSMQISRIRPRIIKRSCGRITEKSSAALSYDTSDFRNKTVLYLTAKEQRAVGRRETRDIKQLRLK